MSTSTTEADNLPCPECKQVDVGQTGEYPCKVCGLPRVWDGEEQKEKYFGINPDCDINVFNVEHVYLFL